MDLTWDGYEKRKNLMMLLFLHPRPTQHLDRMTEKKKKKKAADVASRNRVDEGMMAPRTVKEE